ncbi:ATP-binding protein [Streptomyces tateyamensis]
MSRDLTPGSPKGRGRLRVYLGSAPGVGKTYRMLDEAHRRRDRVSEVPVNSRAVLVLTGRRLPAADQRVLAAFAGHLASTLERDRLATVAAEIEPIKAADKMRTALLAAVSHDLRTPLAAALASIGSLRSPDVEFSREDQSELENILLPFQRLGDNDNTIGPGLGLALSRGLAEAMGGTLEVEETPGGGTTMLLDDRTVRRCLPASPSRHA